MQIGVVFPQTEIGAAVEGVRAYGLQIEALGFAHVLAYDHVLGADPEVHSPWTGPYNVHTTFHEPMVLFGFLAGITSLEMVTCIIILPQRQTALVAKQAAEVDLMTGGRLRLGVGLGWNAVEYEALGKEFTNRGTRMDEQIDLLRRLWTEPTVTHEGEFERITGAGIAPLPVQRPIPVWIGATADVAVARAARIADGWFPQGRADALAEKIADFRRQVEEAGRRPEDVGVDARMSLKSVPEAEWPAEIEAWRALGATHLAVESMGMGLTPDEHIGVVERFAEVVARYGV